MVQVLGFGKQASRILEILEVYPREFEAIQQYTSISEGRQYVWEEYLRVGAARGRIQQSLRRGESAPKWAAIKHKAEVV